MVANVNTYREYKRVYNSVCRRAKQMFYSEKFSDCAKNACETLKFINESIGHPSRADQKFPGIFTSGGGGIFDTPNK